MGCGGSKPRQPRTLAEIKKDLDVAVADYQACISAASAKAEHPQPNEAAASEEVVDAAGTMVRPVRHGKWFTTHESLLPEIEYEEMCDIHAEFLKDHPNGGQKTARFMSVRLNDRQIEKYHNRIRISSYRWKDCKGLGPNGDQSVVPGNYIWFLEYVRERKLILWME